MEVRSALGPAITRAGGIKSKEDDVRSWSVLVWPNPLVEAIRSRATHLGQLSPWSHGRDCLCRRSGRGDRGSAAWLSSPFALKL